ncbi:hypothetical protein JOE25_002440 [Serratia sp. PL17]|uniref:hypothetical protein n=1 Tax=Serratia sp. PL17 TaxID=2806582 RepID=UPI001AE8928C|nr:hypothetical protein [Serratia sp. PL17]MBP1130866.1 hypothetical protein [Serratia sp. PL17]
MKNFNDIIKGVNTSDARSALYYLGRYLKQAEYYIQYGKDFFEDDYQSKPTEEAKGLTLKLIDFIESYQEKKASDFTDEEYMFWVEKLNEVESKLDPEPTEEQRKLAESIINEIFQPPLTGEK